MRNVVKKEKCVLAYSGGMDSTLSIPWIMEHYGLDVITLTLDLCGDLNLQQIKQRAQEAGAVECVIQDIREEFIKNYAFKALLAGAIYENTYPLSTALARPLMALRLVETAQNTGAVAVAHGCTGKGNDQVRFDLSVKALRAHTEPLRIITPAREWEMTRDEEKIYAKKANISLDKLGGDRIYSIDRNIWGQAIEGEDLEDIWHEPPEDAHSLTNSPIHKAPNTPEEVTISFESGVPTAINMQNIEDTVKLVSTLNTLAGKHGIGRIDHLENRLVGIKSREVYEAPAATLLFVALAALEKATLSREQHRLKSMLSVIYADLVYDGRWFTALRENIDDAISSIQRYTTGDVRVRLYKGQPTVTGIRSHYSLYDYNLATYSYTDSFDHTSATGFIDVYSLPAVIQRRNQIMKDAR